MESSTVYRMITGSKDGTVLVINGLDGGHITTVQSFGLAMI